MFIRLLICCLAFACCLSGRSQEATQKKIDSLKKELPRLHDSARIDCLNGIASLFSFSYLYHDYDSVSPYAYPALSESRKLNYRHGIIAALFSLGNNEVRSDNKAGCRHLKELIRLADDDSIISYSYLRLGQCLYNQARFEEAAETLKTAASLYKKKGDLAREASSLGLTGVCYMMKGNFEKSFEFTLEAFKISKTLNNRRLSIPCNLYMADLYLGIHDYTTAEKYISEAFRLVTPEIIPMEKAAMVPRWLGRACLTRRGDLFFNLNQYDSALYYYQFASRGYTDPMYKLRMADVFMAQKKYAKAIPLLIFTKDECLKVGDYNTYMHSLVALGKVGLQVNQIASASRYAKLALAIGLQKRATLVSRDAYELLASIYEKTGRTNEALSSYKQYILLKDSILSDQYKGKLLAFKQAAREELRISEFQEGLKKQKEISEQKLKNQQQLLIHSRRVKNVLLGGILLILVMGYIIFHNVSLRRRNEKLQHQQMESDFRHKTLDLEMQALRAQINPHFIFNCLSSINRFILKNETEAASDYLTRFSQLIRQVLVHSQSSQVLLKDELSMLRNYIDLEQLRFRHSFEYSIIVENSIDEEITLIPPLLIQPFCENAIRHGLMHKNGLGLLEIKLSKQGSRLLCVIKDNGIGRARASEYKSRQGNIQKSMGLKITNERLALINKETGLDSSYEIEDVIENGKVAGTKVSLFIGYKLEEADIKNTQAAYDNIHNC